MVVQITRIYVVKENKSDPIKLIPKGSCWLEIRSTLNRSSLANTTATHTSNQTRETPAQCLYRLSVSFCPWSATLEEIIHIWWVSYNIVGTLPTMCTSQKTVQVLRVSKRENTSNEEFNSRDLFVYCWIVFTFKLLYQLVLHSRQHVQFTSS